MARFPFVLLFIILTFSTLHPIIAKSYKTSSRGSSSHSYPKSHSGLSGGGHSGGLSGGHGYPSSGGSHSYPSGGLSGGGSAGSHSYPSSGGSHSYPTSGVSHSYPSGGLSGGGTGGSHSYPSSGGKYPSSGGSHGYPSTGGVSGTGSGAHSYPGGGSKLSGGTQSTSNVHYHYHYTPPKQIVYTPVHGAPVSYPVYTQRPPNYVYAYKESGSKYGTLLAGLALLNLGTLAGTAYMASHNNYKPAPGEVCKFGVRKSNGDTEVTKIDCQLITSFIFQEQSKPISNPTSTNTTSTTTTTNVTTVNTGNVQPNTTVTGVTYTMFPNGTLVPVNITSSVNNTGSTNTTTSVTSVVTTTTTVSNAVDVKGKEIQVTPDMECYVIRQTPSSQMKKTVPCTVLQSYATQSLRKNSAARHSPTIALLAVVFAIFVAH